VVIVSAGATHSLFVKIDGTLWAMGDNTYGQLGVGSAVRRQYFLCFALAERDDSVFLKLFKVLAQYEFQRSFLVFPSPVFSSVA